MARGVGGPVGRRARRRRVWPWLLGAALLLAGYVGWQRGWSGPREVEPIPFGEPNTSPADLTARGDGRLYVADLRHVYELGPDGRSRPFHELERPNPMHLAPAPGGALYEADLDGIWRLGRGTARTPAYARPWTRRLWRRDGPGRHAVGAGGRGAERDPPALVHARRGAAPPADARRAGRAGAGRRRGAGAVPRARDAGRVARRPGRDAGRHRPDRGGRRADRGRRGRRSPSPAPPRRASPRTSRARASCRGRRRSR